MLNIAIKMEDKSSNEILDEMFRDLEEKSAKGELQGKADLSTVLGNTLVNEERMGNDERGVKRKHKHSKHKSKKSKKHKKKSKRLPDREKPNKSVSKEPLNEMSSDKDKENAKMEDKDNNVGCLEDGELEDSQDHVEFSKYKKKSRSKAKSDKSGKPQTDVKVKHCRSHRSRSSSIEGHHRPHSHSLDHSENSRKEKSKKISSERRRSRSKDRKRSKSPNKEEKIDKAKLLEVARKNALVMLSEGRLPKSAGSEKLKSEHIASIRAGGKSVEELTDFCKLLSDKEKEEIQNRDYLSDDEQHLPHEVEEGDKTAPFIHHPFKLKDPPAPIIMNIKSAVQLPTKTLAEKVADSAKLRLQFPVSSGTQHRKQEWIPVNPKEKAKQKPAYQPEEVVSTPAVEDKVFPDLQANPPLDIGSIVSDRLKAIRALDENPHDVQALGLMYKSQQQMQNWAESKQLPGQFTGSTGVQILSPQELAGPSNLQAWVRKDQFQRATPVQSRFGLFMLQKMGWKPGEGLGKNKEGTCEPLNIEIKLDKKGLVSQGELPRKPIVTTVCKDLSAKHPVSALVELCNKRKWLSPDFSLVHDSGPDHRKNFLFKVHVNGVDYQPTIASLNKKHARAQAATVCLQSMGLLPRDVEIPM